MSISLAEAQKRGWLPSEPATTTTHKPVRIHPLLERLTPICTRYNWHCDLYRAFSTDPRSAALVGTKTTGRPNALVLWRTGRVAHLGWIWDVETWTEEEIAVRLETL